MGYNSTLIILNDALHEIGNDPDFGKKVEAAIQQSVLGKRIDISSGYHANAATVIECHHADHLQVIAIGGNTGQVLGSGGGYRNTPEEMLKYLADSLGYRLTKKPKKEVEDLLRLKPKA